jgi:CPA1 family monovalent cation:H+ antiporter
VPSGAVLVAGLARRLEVPYPALLALAGAGLAFLPFAPAIEIEPDLALALFVAPVLLDAAFDTSPRDLKRYAVSVASLAVVAVNFAVTGFPFPEPLPSTE